MKKGCCWACSKGCFDSRARAYLEGLQHEIDDAAIETGHAVLVVIQGPVLAQAHDVLGALVVEVVEVGVDDAELFREQRRCRGVGVSSGPFQQWEGDAALRRGVFRGLPEVEFGVFVIVVVRVRVRGVGDASLASCSFRTFGSSQLAECSRVHELACVRLQQLDGSLGLLLDSVL